MYDVQDDLYCYPGTRILRNKAGLRNQKLLNSFELAMTTQRFDEPLPAGRFGVRHFCAVHHHLFQDVYAWAGKIRRVRISRNGSAFCYPERIVPELERVLDDLKKADLLKGLSKSAFTKEAAHLLAELNAIHAFRDGNGRSQMAFMQLIATRAGYALHLVRLRPRKFLSAMIASFYGKEEPLRQQIASLIR